MADSLNERVELAKEDLDFLGSWDLDGVKKGELLYEFNPDNPSSGRTKTKVLEDMNREDSKEYQGFEIMIADGGDGVPGWAQRQRQEEAEEAIEESTEETYDSLGKDANVLTRELQEMGYELLSPDAYHQLQLIGKMYGKQFDASTPTWLKGYLSRFSAVPFGFFIPGLHEMDLEKYYPEDTNPYLGGRRAVRVLRP